MSPLKQSHPPTGCRPFGWRTHPDPHSLAPARGRPAGDPLLPTDDRLQIILPAHRVQGADRIVNLDEDILIADYTSFDTDGASVDTLSGCQGTDWFFANCDGSNGGPLDIVTDRSATE